MMRRRFQPKTKKGFTLVELLVTIGIIVFLIAIGGVVFGRVIGGSRVARTRSTIKQLHEILRKRMDALTRHMRRMERGKNLPDYAVYFQNYGRRSAIAMGRKLEFRNHFPQYEVHQPNGSVTEAQNAIEVAEIFYDFIMNGATFGASTPDIDQFASDAIGDTDGDNRNEFIDAWGRPILFYRWPTRLIRPNGTVVDSTNASILMTSLPDNLGRDPDDPLGVLGTPPNGYLSTPSRVLDWHDPSTFHVPLIISAGPDGNLGLYDPHDKANFGHLAQTNGDIDALYDNITNQNQRAGADR